MPAYAFRSVGTTDAAGSGAALTPGAPAGRAVGDLLIGPSFYRIGSQSLAALSAWTQIYADNDSTAPSLEVWARIADGTSADIPPFDWTGSGNGVAWIEAYSGDVYTDLATIVAHSVATQGGSLSSIVIASLAITTDNTMVYACGGKVKTATSNDATTVTAGGGLTKRNQYIGSGTSMICVSASLQQTTATDYDGTDFTRDGTNESANYSAVVLSLRTAAASSTPTGRMLMTGIG